MSLINEALKRTRDASSQSVTAVLPVPPPYQNQAKADSHGSKSGLLVTMVVALVAVVAILVVSLRVVTGIQKLKDGFTSNASVTTENATQTERPSAPVPIPATPAKTEAPAPEQMPAILATAKSSVTPVATTKTAEDELVGRLMEKIKAEQATTTPKPSPVDLPKLVLQGITSAADGNEAMINGVTLRQGEDIEGARITTIDRRSVRLDLNGREIVLRLP